VASTAAAAVAEQTEKTRPAADLAPGAEDWFRGVIARIGHAIPCLDTHRRTVVALTISSVD
jgi:hypothetical protein